MSHYRIIDFGAFLLSLHLLETPRECISVQQERQALCSKKSFTSRTGVKNNSAKLIIGRAAAVVRKN
jgi:hypothetical protein